MGGCSYEVTTYRIDGEYEDNRHPKNVMFTSKLSEDLLRRDFTINAMAYNSTEGLVDMYGGIDDLNHGIIRCVGDAEARFDEDALRTLRAIRFAGQLGFNIEEKTYEAIKNHAECIRNVSAERIRVEVTKLIMSNGADRLKLLADTGLSNIFFPEWDEMLLAGQNNPHHSYSVGEHTIKVIENIHRLYPGKGEKDFKILCWSALLHDVGKPECRFVDEKGIDHFYGHEKSGEVMAEAILKRLKFDNYTIETTKRLVACHDYRFNGSKKSMRKFVSKVGADIMPLLFILMEADVCGQSDYHREEKLQRIKQAKETFDELIAANTAFTVKDLEINGKELISAGIPAGKALGDVLKALLEMVLEEPELNEKSILLANAKKIFEKVCKEM